MIKQLDLKKLVKDKNLFVISGSMGSGKTILAKYLKNQLDNTVIYDDYSYKMESEEALREYNEIRSGIIRIRHTSEKFIICTYGLPNRLLDDKMLMQYLNRKIVWLFTSIDMYSFYDYPITVPSFIVDRFRRMCRNSDIKKGRKTRPFLLVTKEFIKIGRYKKVKTNDKKK